MSFKNGSAGGLDALTPQHFKDLVCGATGDSGRVLLNDITNLINFMLSGKVNPEVTNLLYGANLCALKKKDGSIRPIAVGNTLRRIASKVCCRHVLPTLEKKFQPLQLGFGSKGGCEAAVHSLRSFLTNAGGDVVLKVDVKNAFNSVDRSILLEEIKTVIPEVYPYLFQCYGAPSHLLYRNNLIESAVGCQQGDPLGPAIFSLAIHPIISKLNSKLNMWYLDDGTLGGDATGVFEDFNYLLNALKSIGLELNFSKCELFISEMLPATEREIVLNKFYSLSPDLKIVDKKSLRLLGSPVLEDSIPPFFDELLSKFDIVSERLGKIKIHMAYQIIRFCIFVPKFTYFLRCCPAWKFLNLLSFLDSQILGTLSNILNCNLDDRSWSQASLPIRFGSLGIRKASAVALPAFLSSIHSTSSLFQKITDASLGRTEISYCAEARDAWSEACPGVSPPLDLTVQRLWDEPLCRKTHTSLLDSSTCSAERARLLAVSVKESGFWLHAIPSSNLGTVLDNTSFSIAVSLRLVLTLNHPHCCPCGVQVDHLGHHGLSCRRSAGRQSRHASLNDVIRRALATVNVPAQLEPNGVVRDDGRRPDGLTLIPWKNGRCLVWDATCVDTLAPSHLTLSSRAAGVVATDAEIRKLQKYASLSRDYIFLPFGVETMGPWGSDARSFYKHLSKRLIECTNDQRAGAYLGQRISLAIQRGNVASVLGTLPKDNNLDEAYYI
ncbi:uncharacterized protein [Epargyreus clarus]|uniref:uncharacterized protein n=1 Tax=Epargyreus clarus TaxID=520877 RepID=UPI003C307977